MGQSDEDDMEIETYSDVGASKVSDDSGIEDMNDDGCPLNNGNGKHIGSDDSQPAVITDKNDFSVSTKDLNYGDIDDTSQDAALPCIYPLPLNQMPLIPKRQNVKDANAIAGICGLQNLGNTCFINAGLQCMLKTPLATTKFSKQGCSRRNPVFPNEMMEALVTFKEKFNDISNQVTSGQYSSICPSDFHRALANAHSSFADHKQHDCQEFLLFVLNALHETCGIQRDCMNTSAVMHEEAQSMRGNGIRVAEGIQESEEDCKRMKMDQIEADEPDAGVECEEGISDAERSWRQYTKHNNSPVVETFHGQFKSVVTCGKCQHISVTHEPFVCVSTPIPYAMEKQAVVTWLPSPKHDRSAGKIKARRYLVIVKEYGHVKDIRESLMQMLRSSEDSEIRSDDVILAEVRNSTIVRTLDDRMQTQYLEMKDTDLYAVEAFSVFDKNLGYQAKNIPIEKLTKEDLNQLRETGSPTFLDPSNSCLCRTMEEDSSQNNSIRKSRSALSYMKDSLSGDESITACCASLGGHLGSGGNDPCECIDEKQARTEEDEDVVKPSASGWHSCSICLEDIFDNELTIHTKCGGMLCNGCLETTNLYHGNRSFPCPVCRTTVVSSDFKAFVNSTQAKATIRNITVPLLFRHAAGFMQSDGRKKQFTTIGHPALLIVPSQVSSSDVYQKADVVLQQYGVQSKYRLILTDSQGQNCVRCDPMSRCSGCTLDLDTLLTLRPGDHFTVDFATVSDELVSHMSVTIDDQSMKKQRHSDVVQLEECFQSFCESESLGEENTWFCPECKVDQVATKVMAISRFPDIAIVHLKRFYFEGLQSRKVVSPVSFPLENLNLDNYSSAENVGKETFVYDLVSCVCHTGDLSTGHYTSYAKEAETGKWYYFNDEVYSEKKPNAVDCEKVYLLFYQRKSTGKENVNTETKQRTS